ncbi:hypothetical protein WDU94_004442 [Cyamophila willieti]
MSEIKEIDKDLAPGEICERCSMVLVKPTFRSSSGHEICSPCHTEALLENNLELESDSDEESIEDSEEEYEDAMGLEEGDEEDPEKTDMFECYEMYQSSANINQNRPGSMRPHTFGGAEKKRNILMFGCGGGTDEKDGLTDDSNDELRITKLRPPEHKKSFIDMITQKLGMNISYNSSNEDDLEDPKSEYSDEVEENEILEEVFKKNSICSFDSGKSGASSVKFKTIVCPLESCLKYVSVSELVQHVLLHHPKISLENVECNETVSFFVEGSSIRTQKITHEKIFVIDNESSEDTAYFVFNITRQYFEDMDMILIWISKIKTNTVQYLCKVRARNAENERSYFGPISNHQDPLVVFQNGDCLVIPITFFENFKEKEDDLALNITFFVGSEDGLFEDIGDRNRSN